MKINKHLIIALATLVISPSLALAFSAGNFSEIVYGLINTFGSSLVVLIISLSVVFFIINTLKFIQAKEDKTRNEARKAVIFSIVGITVAVSVWSFAGIIQRTFGVEGGSFQETQSKIKGLYNGSTINNSNSNESGYVSPLVDKLNPFK